MPVSDDEDVTVSDQDEDNYPYDDADYVEQEDQAFGPLPDYAQRDEDGLYCALCERRFMLRERFEDHRNTLEHTRRERDHYRRQRDRVMLERDLVILHRDFTTRGAEALNEAVHRASYPGLDTNRASMPCDICHTIIDTELLPDMYCDHCGRAPVWHHAHCCPQYRPPEPTGSTTGENRYISHNW